MNDIRSFQSQYSPPSRYEEGLHFCPDRRSSDSIKWNQYGPDVLPLWVADMDAVAPNAVLDALRDRMAHGVFGYGRHPDALAALIVERLDQRYHWSVKPDDIVFVPGVMPGANLACMITTGPCDAVAIQTPVYPPIRRMPEERDRKRIEIEFARDGMGRSYIDWDDFGRALDDSARLFVLCNPQNPTGRVFDRGELERLAAHCLRRGVFICSDEIHSDLTVQDKPRIHEVEDENIQVS